MGCNQSLETLITMVKCTNAGGQTKGANNKSIVPVHQHGRDDVTWKPLIAKESNDLAKVLPESNQKSHDPQGSSS